MLKLGIVGLPNVGKSTLFTAITKSQAEISNYPFTTIDPNMGIVEVPDHRLDLLADIFKSKKIVKALVEFIDIAGLVKNASRGEGLGNKFLANIREANLIAQVVRVFENSNITHVHNKIAPSNDIETINTELIIADIQTLESHLEKEKRKLKSSPKETEKEIPLLENWLRALNNGKLLNKAGLTEEETEKARLLNLLTIKPFIYVLNVSESQLVNKFNPSKDLIEKMDGHPWITLAANLELELSNLPPAERKEYMTSIQLEESGLNRLAKISYETLNLISFLTTGEEETRAWTIVKNTNAQRAAGVIHTDFEKNFIKAEIINWQELLNIESWTKAKELGKIKLAGKDYIMKDGDTVYFHIGK